MPPSLEPCIGSTRCPSSRCTNRDPGEATGIGSLKFSFVSAVADTDGNVFRLPTAWKWWTARCCTGERKSTMLWKLVPERR